MPKNQKEYTGTWIPAHVMEDKDISSTAKLLYAIIASFKQTHSSNAYFAKLMNVDARTIQRHISELEGKDYIARTGDDTKRVIIAVRDDPTMTFLSGGGDRTVVATMTTLSPYINNDSNKDNNSIVSFSEDIKKLYHGWLIEFIIGSETYFTLNGERRAEEIKRAEFKTRLTPKRSEKFRLRLEDAGFKMCARAIKNAAKSEWNMGNNPGNWKATPEWLFNSYEKIEEWANKKEQR